VAEHHADVAIPTTDQPKAADPETTTRPAGASGPSARLGSFAVGAFFGGGLVVLGFLAGVLVLLDPGTVGGDFSQAALAARWLRALWLVLAFGLAGSAAFIALRSSSILLGELLDRNSHQARQLEEGLGRAVPLLERIAVGIEHGAESRSLGQPTESGQARPATTGLQDRMAELKAAREVNDPTRVLELYHAVAPGLEAEPRRHLQSEVAEWFLTVIYRRLRTGKIQVDVVDLAARFAESFAATTQGASVLAALPMLRRSAGLCPRCAQPYIGTGQACPQCLRPGNMSLVPGLPSIDPSQPD
jgi:hypothetical protein